MKLIEELIKINVNVPDNIQAMLNTWEEITKANPLDDTRIYGSTKVSLKPTLNKDALYMVIGAIEKGHASKALKKITDLADDFGVTIEIVAKPFGSKSLNLEQLVSWYTRNGFESNTMYPDNIEKYQNGNDKEGLAMIRHPNRK